MKIALVAGRLEQGQDGVGDYTRRLAAACVQRGHEVGLLSIGERDGFTPVASEPWPTMRTTLAEWCATDGAAARHWIEEFAPDWTSLQFVPYSFDPRGMFGPRVAALAALLGSARRRHVFVHEIWIGSHVGASWREKYSGWRQRRALADLLRRVRPDVIHTNASYHVDALASIGQTTRALPLFGNLPVRAGVAGAALEGIASDALVGGMFGTLHEGWRAAGFLDAFQRLAAELGRPAALVAVGNPGAAGAKLFARIGAEWRGRIECRALGWRTAGELASVFARFDFGVTSVPWNIVGKSGSVAALREHGLRVVVTAAGSPGRFAGRKTEDANDAGLVPFFRFRGLDAAVLEKTTMGSRLDQVAEQFLADLNDRG